jgi:D-alanyl-D-alanine carboxypeptidase/D-alanyl-D-alanine-endopeptidase (penicillin-binding protein 4)
MGRISIVIFFLLFSFTSYSQELQIERFLSDSTMKYASVSLCITDAETGNIIYQHDPEKSLKQASVLKLVTTAAALELLGKDYTFKTSVYYSGRIRKGSGILDGDIIIKGGGDPALGSENFPDFYNGFTDKWINDIRALGIKKITGGVIADDSRYDYQPVPPGWSWEDLGNYYGSGAYGLSVFDNTLFIHFKTSEKGTTPLITALFPEGSGIDFTNFLTASGTVDNGYIYSAPYSNKGCISGTIPENNEDFILKGSIPDPPLFLANTFQKKLKDAGIKITSAPSSIRLKPEIKTDNLTLVSETISPPLSTLIEVLNHKSVNLYAEQLVKELGKVFNNSGTTASGIQVIMEFLDSAGLKTDGMFIDDGSGLSSLDAVSSAEMVKLLLFMKKNGRFYADYYQSLPEPGKEGTLKNYFRDPVFESKLRAKSGSLTRVRSYAGYFTSFTGKDMIFCIIVNNYIGPSKNVIQGIEGIIKEVILTR